MGYSFDVFVAAMKCSNCELISPDDDSTNMQTYLRDDPQLENLGVGSFVGDSFHEMEDKHYFKIKDADDTKTTLLNTWTCPHCGYPNWAKIVFANGFIVEIRATVLNKSTLDSTNYISLDAASDAMELSQQDYLTVLDNGIVSILQKYLK